MDWYKYMTETVKSKIIKYPHGFSVRTGGVSEGTFASLNLGMNRGDDEKKVKKNWEIFLESCQMAGMDFVCGKQIHENNVAIVGRENASPAYGQKSLIEADGYVSAEPLVPVAIFTADCTPLLLADEENRVVGAIHCGWRSTVSDIEKNAIDAMVSLGGNPKSIKASMGPAIGICCFEVGPEVVKAACELVGMDMEDTIRKSNDFALVKPSRNEGKYMLDLQGFIKLRLLQLGLREENIEILDECTMCKQGKYWSHRGTAGIRGSQANIIMIPG